MISRRDPLPGASKSRKIPAPDAIASRSPDWTAKTSFVPMILGGAQRSAKLAAPVKRVIISALSERDETAEICTGEKDVAAGIVGYEINFNRYFYVYEPPRPLEKIEADSRTVEGGILELLRQVAGCWAGS
jgi:hypothetical protein